MASIGMNSVWSFIAPFVILLTQIYGDKRPRTVSMEIGRKSFQDQDMVQIVNLPEVLSHGMWITVEYRCSRDRIIGVELIGKTEKRTKNSEHKLFKKAWKCRSENKAIKKKHVKLKLCDSQAFRQDLFNSKMTFVTSPKLQAWNLDTAWWPSCRKWHNAFWRASVKVSYDIKLPSPHFRPSKGGVNNCPKWPLKILAEVQMKTIEMCRREPEYIHAVTFPVAINGLSYGIVRQLPKYTDENLESHREKLVEKPIFTISAWLYILDFCPQHDLCSLMYHVTIDYVYLSPLIFINNKGQLHIQMNDKDLTTFAAVTNIAVPKKRWFRLVLSCARNHWTVTITQGKYLNETSETSYTVHGSIYLNDTDGLFVFGAFDYTPSFKGYIGQATYYRNRLLQPEEIPMPSPYHPMFELDLTRRTERCDGYRGWVSGRTRYYQQQRKEELIAGQCHTYFWIFLRRRNAARYDDDFSSRCSQYGEPKSKFYAYVDKVIRKSVRKRRYLSPTKIGLKLYNRAIRYIDQGFDYVRRAIPLLKQASCYDNYDAMYVLATLLNNGVKVKADELQSQAYLMKGCLERHRMSCLSLAHKHRYGLDGVPQDNEQAFIYYKYVADTVRQDKEDHKETDVMTESVRLTDEEQLLEQTDEEGDVFHWLKHQASKGVFTAQQHIARSLFWGSQGLKRNMAAATEYFRLGAESKDPQAMYDYGIIMLKGQGTKENKTEGLHHIRASAEKKNPSALNALGWYAHNFDKNITAAIEYFEKAYKGGNPDAAYNLGSFHMNGEFPGKPSDTDVALNYFNFAAVRNQIDAGVMVAMLNMKGTPRRRRDVHVANEWARYIAEKNPALGYVLRKGLQAYRNGDMSVSLLYYMMAADAGIEVGSFNMAWLCDQNTDGIVHFIEKECQWRQYNITTLRDPRFVDTYALIKMGDYYWYGCGGHQNHTRAADLYSQAAVKNDPHAIFNLGFMMEDGVRIHPSVWRSLHIPRSEQANNYTLLRAVYTKCRDSANTDAYLPCWMALHRLQAIQLWSMYGHIVQAIGFVLSGVVTVLSLRHIVWTFRNSHRSPDLEV